MIPDDTQPNYRLDKTRPQRAAGQDLTQQVGAGAETSETGGEGGLPWKWLLLLALVTILVLMGSAVTGYVAGAEQREQSQAQIRGELLQEQFDLGVADLEEGRLTVAKQRFEYILETDPDYPGARDLLTLIQQGLNEPTSTPSPTATVQVLTPTPTISLDSLDGLLEAARGANAREAWDETIEVLMVLKRRDPNYRLQEVNAEIFRAYRNRGMANIFLKDLERGIYDLTMASRVGTLDSQAQSWMRSAAFYQFANSFIGLDWREATINFADLCAAAIWDSCFKYARSAKEYGHMLAKEEDYCAASDQYSTSLNTRSDNQLEPTATWAHEACLTATASPPTPTPTGTLLTGTPPTATVPGPSGTPSHTPTPSPTNGSTPPGPSATPSPSPSPTTASPPAPTVTSTPTATEEPTATPEG
jgi:tetratricopeptide (TPR) repeat protein